MALRQYLFNCRTIGYTILGYTLAIASGWGDLWTGSDAWGTISNLDIALYNIANIIASIVR